MIVASMKMAKARPTPICLVSSELCMANSPNTATMMIAALVTVPAVLLMPCATASAELMPPSARLTDAAEDEHVVVHREAEEDHEQEQREPAGDRAVGLEAQQLLAVAVLEDQRQQAVGRRRPTAG